MFIEKEYTIGLSDIGISNKIKNKSLLNFLENIGGKHSDIAKLGVEDIERTKLSWIIMGWKVQIIKRPKYGETIKIKTWSRKANKIYAYRDFEIYSDTNELIGKATSKWILYDIEKNGIATLTEELLKPYEQETEFSAFEEEPKYKIVDLEFYERKADYKITRNMIDINEHVHNTNYMDFATEALPKEMFLNEEFNNFEIAYKKEIKYGSTVKCCYGKKDETSIIIVKDESEENIHAMIKLY